RRAGRLDRNDQLRGGVRHQRARPERVRRMSEGRRKTLSRSLIGTGVARGGAAVGIAAERYMVRRARAAPDPTRDEPLDARPGVEHRLTSFDGTELAVNVVGPDRGPTLVFIHGFSPGLAGCP